MEKREILLELPAGYSIFEKSEEVDLYVASELLRTRVQKHITGARRMTDRAVFISHRIKCPHCRKETPAYNHYLNKLSVGVPKRSRSEIDSWAQLQPSLFEAPDEFFSIQEERLFSGSFICPRCGFGSDESMETVKLFIIYGEGCLCLRKEIGSLNELVSYKWISGSVKLGFPAFAQIVFDFRDRNTYFELVSGAEVICREEASSLITDLNEDALVGFLNKNKIVKRTVKRIFKEMSGYEMAFSVNELDFNKFVAALKFQGFTKSFYESVPYNLGTTIISQGFREIAESLGNPEEAIQLLKTSELPFCSSLKKLFAEKSGMFFYLKECEKLYAVLKDINLFCRFLRDENIFYYLCELNWKPGIFLFLKEYAEAKGGERLVALLQYRGSYILNYAGKYFALSDCARSFERECWDNDSDFFRHFDYLKGGYNTLSVPMKKLPERIKDCVIGQYSFKALKTKKEYILASEKLKNCLWKWETTDNPVVTVSTGEKMVAAVEIQNNSVFQARRKYNDSIQPTSELFGVIEKWCRKYGIEIDAQTIDGPFFRE